MKPPPRTHSTTTDDFLVQTVLIDVGLGIVGSVLVLVVTVWSGRCPIVGID